MRTIKKIVLGIFITFTGVQCWGAAAQLNGDDRMIQELVGALMQSGGVRAVQDYMIQVAGRGDVAALQKLSSLGFNVDMIDGHNNTALTKAASAGRAQAVQSLIVARANVDHVMEEGKTALMVAAEGCSRDEMVELLLANRAAVNKVDRNNWTALTWCAASNGNDEVVKILLKYGVNTHIISTESGVSRRAIDYALRSGESNTMVGLLRVYEAWQQQNPDDAPPYRLIPRPAPAYTLQEGSAPQ